MHMRNDSDLLGRSTGKDEKGLDSEYILKGELTRFLDRLCMECEREISALDNTAVFDLSSYID